MEPYLILSIEDVRVVLQGCRFVPQQDYRSTPVAEAGEETIAGTPIVAGPAVRPKHVWNIPFWATRDEYSRITALWEIWDHKRRNPDIVLPANNNVIIDDGHEELREYAGVNSRALAIRPDFTTSPAPTSVSSAIIQYFSRFYGRFTAKPTRALTRGPYILTTIAIRESDLFAA